MSKRKKKSKKEKPKNVRLGIDPLSIFKEIEKESTLQNQRSPQQEELVDNKSVRTIPLKYIYPDPNQPRKEINAESDGIKELAESIKNHGFINFITVRKEDEKKYIIVAGERRYTAAKVAELAKIPVIISQNKKLVDYALIQMEENLQREDLNVLDELNGYNRLISEFELKQKDIVKLVNKNKSYISKMMSLNKLSEEIKSELENSDTIATKDILWDVASFNSEDQKFIWNKIRTRPIRSTLNIARKQLVERKENIIPKKKKSKYEPEIVWKALKKAASKDKDLLLEFISPKKIEQLLKKFGQ